MKVGDCCDDSHDFVRVLEEPERNFLFQKLVDAKKYTGHTGLGSVGSIEVGAQHSQFSVQKHMFFAVNDAQRSAVEDIAADAGQK